MELEEFADLLDRRGENLALWPDAEAAAARDLLVRSDAARRLFGEARALRRLFDAPPVRAPAGLVDRILAAAGSDRSPADPDAAPDEQK